MKKQKQKYFRDKTTDNEINEKKTHSKVVGEKIKEIYLKVL